MTKKFVIGILFFIITLQLVNTVFAASFAIAPAFKDIDFRPNSRQEFKVRIYNNQATDLHIVVGESGDLRDFITVEKHSLTIKPFNYETLVVKLNLPNKLSFGVHTARLVFTSKSGSGMISGALSLNFDVRVHVRESSELLLGLNYSGDKKKFFELTLSNTGFDTKKGYAEFWFLHKNTTIKFYNQSFLITPNNTIVMRKSFTSKPGHYNLVVKVYSKELNVLSRDFSIGKPIVVIGGINIGNESGSIKSVDVKTLLKWNEDLEVLPEVFLLNDSRIISSSSFDSTLIRPYNYTNIKLFVELPKYKVLKLKVVLHYLNYSVEKSLILSNNNGNVEVIRTSPYLVLIILLVLANLVLLVKLFLFSKNKLERINKLLISANKSLDGKDLRRAKLLYHKLRIIYEQLNTNDKKKVHDSILKLYERIKDYE